MPITRRRGWGGGALIASLTLVGAIASPAGAQTGYRITVDTTAIASALNGFLDAQFNNGGTDALAATAALSNFTISGGSLGGTILLTGDATGSFSAGTIKNGIVASSALNDINQNFAIGTSFAFDVQFSGPALSPIGPPPSTGSSFAFALFGSDNATPFPTSSPDNQTLALIEILPDGTLVPTAFNSLAANAPHVLITPLGAVPEPGTLSLLLLGAIRIRRRKAVTAHC